MRNLPKIFLRSFENMGPEISIPTGLSQETLSVNATWLFSVMYLCCQPLRQATSPPPFKSPSKSICHSTDSTVRTVSVVLVVHVVRGLEINCCKCHFGLSGPRNTLLICLYCSHTVFLPVLCLLNKLLLLLLMMMMKNCVSASEQSLAEI